MNNKVRTIIGISGASGSGKSWFAKKIKEMRPDSVCLFDLDCYYKDVAYVNTLDYRHDNPAAIDYDKALNDLELLIKGHEVRIPIYDYDTHAVIGEKICTSTSIIVIEGLFIFTNKKILDKMDLKIWIDANEELRFERRIDRDINERGDDFISAKSRYESDVKPAFEKFINPCKKHADLVYMNDSNDNTHSPILIKMLFLLCESKNNLS